MLDDQQGLTCRGFRAAQGSYPCQPHHEAKLDDIAVDEQKLGPPVLLALGNRVSRGGRASKVSLAGLVWEKDISQAAEEEEGVCAEAVEENDPGDECAAKAKPGSKVRQEQGHNDVDKLVAAVGNEVEELRRVVDGEQEGAGAYDEDLEQGDGNGQGCGIAQQLRVERAPQACQQCREQDVCHQSHGGDVHVGRVDVFARRLVEQGGRGCRVGAMALLAGPRAVPPRHEDDAQFGEDIRVCHVEVVLEGGNGYEAAKLCRRQRRRRVQSGASRHVTYILLDVLLAGIHGALAHLEAQLGRGVVDEAAKRGVHAVGRLLGHAAALLAVSISALGLRGRLRGRR